MGGRGNLSYWNGGGRISFSCAYPDGGSYGWSPGSGEIPCRTVTVNGHDAALYTYSSEYGDSCLLVWEDEAGVLFWFTGSDVDPDTLVEAASSVEPTSKTAPACEADWLPGGYSWFETNASGGAAETTWVGQGGNITLTCSATPLLMPEGDGETVRFGGVTARFWEAEKPHEAETDAWEPETVGRRDYLVWHHLRPPGSGCGHPGLDGRRPELPPPRHCGSGESAPCGGEPADQVKIGRHS